MTEEMSCSMEERLKSIKVLDLMSRFAITTKENTNIAELAHLLMRFKISGLPVVSESGEIIGIVTATDLFNQMQKIINDIEGGADPLKSCQAPIKQIMTRDVFTITPETTLYEVIRLMCGKNIHTLPVVAEKEIVGVIGRRDVINACYSLARQI